ncbi:angiopoietin-related protein 7-like [Pecten maximus]|uniref:angiopoietin-related protein 7-like n=1 Tax=Pecten maximus TaxID=6579 RepID=UPI001458C6B7|nr:angiopoietin-related protein 7-like [Pecten maximus]
MVTHQFFFVDAANCSDVNPAYCSGVYRVTLTSGLSIDVYCDMNTDEGPWTVIQNRQDGQVDFYRNWTDYKTGFGDLNGNFWAGLDVIHLLTQTISTLRIELVSWHGDTAYAQYSFFRIADESSKYRLSVSGFSGNVSYDAMAYHNGFQFTTEDNDNSAIGYCALSASGAWWYKSCYDSNLNGPYLPDTRDIYKSMAWYRFYTGRDHVPLMKSRMLVKESDVYL